jgi:subtilisin-like proprotein convertase family protein
MKNPLKCLTRIIFYTALTLWVSQTGFAQTFPGGGMGAIPDGPSPGVCGANHDVTFTVTGISSSLTSVSVNFTITHTWVSDVRIQLIAPNGTSHLIMANVGNADGSDLNGTYTFTDSVSGGIWEAAFNVGQEAIIPATSYHTQEAGPVGNPNPGPPFTSLNAAFAGVPTNMINGTWILRFNDCAVGDTGTVSAANLTLVGSPTAVDLITFNAKSYASGTLIEWQTGHETGNLGFNLYRDEGGIRTRINNQLIAGTALIAGFKVAIQSGESYSWVDKPLSKSGQYWLEDVDLNGKSTWHGPLLANQLAGNAPQRKNAAMLNNLTLKGSEPSLTKVVERVASSNFLTDSLVSQPNRQKVSFSGQAVKIAVKREGLYRITQPELVAAGFNTNVNPKTLQLFVDGIELPISVVTDKNGRFDETASIEFYGLGLDTPATDTHIYWLTAGEQSGKRIPVRKSSGTPTSQTSFTQTVERKDRSIYFAGLKNGEAENFFGSLIGNFITDQTLTLKNIDLTSTKSAELEVALQGVTAASHRVLVEVNGQNVGFVNFDAQRQGIQKLNLAHTILQEGTNVIRLSGQNGAEDISLVNYLRLSYQHTFKADSDVLRFIATNRELNQISGFTSKAIRIWDVTNPNTVEELVGTIDEDTNGGFAVTVAAQANGERILLALTEEQSKHAASLKAEHPSNLKGATGADLVIITARNFFSEIEPLKLVRQAEGYKVAVADIEDIYDEFNYGNKAPAAIKDFLSYARTNWQIKPRFVLLAGDASYDERNYLGLGEFDIIPTKLEETFYLETATDNWFADFNNDGLPEMAVGRLPMRTTADASVMINKTLAYGSSKTTPSVVLVSDANEGYNFEQANAELKPFFPANFLVDEIKRGELGTEVAKTKLLQAIAEGRSIINYMGHGSVGLWRGNLLTAIEARQMRNERQPLFILMTCLNGLFQDPHSDSLSTSLLRAEGGAAAVWASSGLTYSSEQKIMNQELYRLIFERKFNGKAMTIGEATVKAKALVTDPDIRRTWNLLGDPTLRFK